MSPGKFKRLMFKRETLSMMNCYHIKVVSLYQLLFAMSWNGCRNVGRGFQLVLSAFVVVVCFFFLNSFGEKKILSSRPTFCDNGCAQQQSVPRLINTKGKAKSIIQLEPGLLKWLVVKMSALERVFEWAVNSLQIPAEI